MIAADLNSAGSHRFAAPRAGKAAFFVALAVFVAASIAADGELKRVDRNSGGEFERALASVDAAKAALQAFETWSAAATNDEAARREALLESRFVATLDRAEARAASTATRAAAGAIRAAFTKWRAAPPLDARFAALEPALDEARFVQMRLHLTLMVETAITQSLFVQRAAVETASRAKWTSMVAAFAAAVAAGLLLIGAARAATARLGVRIVSDTGRAVAPQNPRISARNPDSPYEATRRKAAERLAAIRMFEAERRIRTDLPFALRGAAPFAIDG